MRWLYDTPGSSIEIAGVVLQPDASGLLPFDLPPHVHAACEASPHFRQVPDPTSSLKGDGDVAKAAQRSKRGK